MTIKFRFRPDFNLVICTHTGHTPEHEYLATYKSLYEHESFDKSMNRIVDLRLADALELDTKTLKLSASFVRAKYGEMKEQALPKIAVIAPEDLVFGLGRMFEGLTGDLEFILVFRSSKAALEWLDLPGKLLDNDDEGSEESLTRA